MFTRLLTVSSSVLLISASSFAATAATFGEELSCRNNAKVVAKESYKNCMSSAKNAQLKKLKDSYSAKMNEVKFQYESEVKRVSQLPFGKEASAQSKVSVNQVQNDLNNKSKLENKSTEKASSTEVDEIDEALQKETETK